MNEELKKALELIKANKENSELKTELKALLPVSAAEAFALVEADEEGKKLLNTFADKRVTDGVKTAVENYKKKEVPKLIADALKTQETEFKGKGVELSEADKKTLAIEKEVADLKRENKIAATKNKLIPIFAASGLDLALVDNFVNEDVDAAVTAATAFSGLFKDAVKKQADSEVQAIFKQIGYDPNNPSIKQKGAEVVTAQQLEAARTKAQQIGTVEARAEYAQLKNKFESSKEQQQ